jgi:hypothetical protein
MIGRRAFIRNSAIGTGASLFTRAAPFSAATSSGIDSRIEVLLDEPLGTISPNIYGHFAEHLGGIIWGDIESGSSPAFQPRVKARFLGSDPLFPRRGFRLVGNQACRLAKHEVCS